MIVSRRLQPARILRAVGLPLLMLLAYDTSVTVLYVGAGQHWIAIDNLPLALLGSALAIIIGLRNNTAYARWWEARTLWGAAVNNSRSLARASLTLLDRETATRLVGLQIAWVHALRLRLRGQDPWPEITPLLPADVLGRVRGAANLPTALQGEMALVLAPLDAGPETAVRLAAIDRTLSALADAQGGLERIKTTPMPQQFRHYPRVFSAAYCLLLPVGLVGELGIVTPIGSTLIGAAFYVMEQIGRDLEDPFAGDVHDVPMAAITRTIEIDLRQMTGKQDVKAPLTPVDGVLL